MSCSQKVVFRGGRVGWGEWVVLEAGDPVRLEETIEKRPPEALLLAEGRSSDLPGGGHETGARGSGVRKEKA